jgi:hypothetical protein
MERNGFVSHVHRKRPKGRPMPEAIRRANTAKSKIRSRVEHVFAEQKDRMGLFIRTIGIARAKTKIGLANLVYKYQTPAVPAAHRGGMIDNCLRQGALNIANTAPVVQVRQNPARKPIETTQPRSMVALIEASICACRYRMAFEVEDVHDAFPYWLVFKCRANGHGLSERGRSAVLRLNCLAQLYSVRVFHHALTAKSASVFCRSFISVGVQVSARATCLSVRKESMQIRTHRQSWRLGRPE